LSIAPARLLPAREALQSLRGYKIGIAWQGNPTFSGDLRRSVPLRNFSALAAVPGVTLVSLQKGAGVEQLQTLDPPFEIHQLSGEWSEAARSFEQTAAIMMALDLVITSDTSIAHLAGALNRPVWVALSYMPDWRWLLDRADSPWYPAMRLFRQPAPGNWLAIFQQMASALSDILRP
jgi:hypothetical protein